MFSAEPAAGPPAAVPATTQSSAQPDWPQFLGPHRDGSSPAAVAWPPGGPTTVWKHPVGHGWAGPAVHDGRVIVYHRQGDRAVLESLDLRTGAPGWTSGHDTRYVDSFGFDDGPRATPAVAGGRVFTLGAEGLASAFDERTGKPLWSVDLVQQYRSGDTFFGFAASPLVEGDTAIFVAGGKDAGLVALDVATGKAKWAAVDDETGYSSPVAATLGGKRVVIAFLRSGVAAVSATDGTVLWRLPFRSRQDASVNAATPLVLGGDVFVSASYQTGAMLLAFDASRPKVVWKNDQSLSSHYATSVAVGEQLYGFHGRQEQGAALRCIDAKTGKVRWSEEGFGAGSITRVGDQLLILTDKGEMVLAAADANHFHEVGRKQVLGFENRAYPAVVGSTVLARDKSNLLRVDLASPK